MSIIRFYPLFSPDICRYEFMILLSLLLLVFNGLAGVHWSNSCDPSLTGNSTSLKGHLESNNVKIPVTYKKAQNGNPTFIFVNGLVYDSSRWDLIKKSLEEKGFGTITYQHRGQWEQMSYENAGELLNVSDINLKNNVDDLKKIIDSIVPSEKVKLVSLSYGSSIAAEFLTKHPEKVSDAFFLSPLIKSLELYEPSGAMIRQSLSMMSMFGPMGQYMSNMWYDSMFSLYFNNLPISSEKLASPIGQKYKKALFEQAKAVKDFNLLNYQFPMDHDFKIHLFLAGKEEAKYVPDQKELWNKIKEHHQGQFITFDNAHHAIPDSDPENLSNEILNIVE